MSEAEKRGDVLLHDGAPHGARILDDRGVPAFDALERLSRTGYGTYILDPPGSTAAQRALLENRPEPTMAAAARDEAKIRDLVEAWLERSGYDGHAGFSLADEGA